MSENKKIAEDTAMTPENEVKEAAQAPEKEAKAAKPAWTKKERKSKNRPDAVKFYKKPGFKYSVLASALCVVFIAAIVGFNILASVLDNRVAALQLDMTANKDYSLSKDNLEYIRKINNDVTITVAMSEDDYTNGQYSSVLQNSLNIYDTSGGKYFSQTVKLLHKYEKENSRIKVRFVDPQTPAFSEFASKYSGQYSYGSMIVESNFTNKKGDQQSRYKILQTNDVYVCEADSNYGAYGYTNITGSDVESAVTSALMYVTAEQIDKALLVTGYGCSDGGYLATMLRRNNYDIEELDSLASGEIADDVSLIVMDEPTKDLLPDEVKKLDTFLHNDNKCGKSLVYVASSAQPQLPNLEGLLDEWGIAFEQGTVYETDENLRSPLAATYMVLYDAGSGFMEQYKDYNYLASSIKPMTLKFDYQGSYQTLAVVKSSDTTTIMPYGRDVDWTPDNHSAKRSFTSLATSSYLADTSLGDKSPRSTIIALATPELFNENYLTTSGYANHDAVMLSINDAVGRVEPDISIKSKVINSAVFNVSETQAKVVKYVVTGVIPIGILLVGIIVVIRRKRR